MFTSIGSFALLLFFVIFVIYALHMFIMYLLMLKCIKTLYNCKKEIFKDTKYYLRNSAIGYKLHKVRTTDFTPMYDVATKYLNTAEAETEFPVLVYWHVLLKKISIGLFVLYFLGVILLSLLFCIAYHRAQA